MRLAVASGVVALAVAALLALMPFADGGASCGSPLSGARGEAGEAPGLVLVVPPDCADAGAKRLVVAGGLVVAGLSASGGGLLLGRRAH